MQLMTTVTGNRRIFAELRRLSVQYNLEDKKFTEFTELDKIVYQNIKKFVVMV